ncbi:MAG TPA: TonB-dependent receptor, partial [Rhodothermales bacterium]
VGVEARLDRLSFVQYVLTPDTDETGAVIEPFVPTIPQESALGFQQFDGVEPISASAYIQDKIEFENFIVNAGLRLDFFDSRARVPADPDDPNIYNPFKPINRFHDLNGDGIISDEEETPENALTVAEREAYWWKDAESKFQVSPRLGVAYPITDEGVVHFSYGHFLQIPTLNLMFQNFGYKVENRSGQYGPFGNPDLKAQKTVMYEIGLRQGIGGLVVDVTGYYRDVRNWVSTSPLILTELPGVTYVLYANRDYANTKGLTLSLSRPFANSYGFDASYTYQVAEGSNSDPSEEFFALQGNEHPTLSLLPLSWDQRHKFAGSFYLGGSNWGASVLGVWASGFPYTPSFAEAANVGSDVEPEFPTNSRRIASTFQVDLSAYREFEVGGIRPRVFVQVYNLFDRRNVVSVFGDTGEPDVTFDQPISSADPGYFVRPENFSEPRRVHVGIEFKF